MVGSRSGLSRKIILGGTARGPDDVTALHQLGLRFAEITISDPANFGVLRNQYRSLSEATGFFYLCHGPREGDPNDIRTLETSYLPKLFRVMDIMPELEMRLLTLHLWMDPGFVSREAIVHKINCLEGITERASGSGITVCLANLSESAAHLGGVFAAVPLLNLTLDLGHAELLSKENTSLGFLESYPDRIKHIHLHDNHGGDSPEDDLHLPVGEGEIDFQRIFPRLHAVHYSGTITLELRPVQIENCLGYVRSLVYPKGYERR
jgi:sugar phosphate isomerase/epimerase